MPCPSDLALEMFLLDPERSELAAHVKGCGTCAARLEQMRREGAAFQREVYPATVAAVVEAAAGHRPELRRPHRPRWTRLAIPLAAAAALVAFLVLRERRPAAARDFPLAVYVEAPSGAQPVGDGARIPADARLRFEVEPRAPCCLWVLSVDSTGDIARLYPPKGDAASEAIVHPPQRQDLPTVAVLDGRPGPARIFAVCTRSPVPWLVVKKAAAEKLRTGDDAVRELRALDGLPAGSSQATLLLEKRS